MKFNRNFKHWQPNINCRQRSAYLFTDDSTIAVEPLCRSRRSRRRTSRMLGRRFISFLRRSPSGSVSSQTSNSGEELAGKAWGRRVVSGVLICLTGGVALSALDDLAIYHGCSSKAIEKACRSEEVINAIGEPIVRGPWYNASLAVAHKRQSVSCTFPVSGPQGTGIFQIKAVRNGDDTWYSFLRPRGWEILVMEGLFHIPSNDEKQRTFRVTVSDNLPRPPTAPDCTACTIPRSQPVENVEKK